MRWNSGSWCRRRRAAISVTGWYGMEERSARPEQSRIATGAVWLISARKQVYKKKNKNFIAEIVLVHEVKTAQIFLRIYKNKEYIREFEILSTYPDEFYFSQYLGRIKWVDDKTVAIEQKNGINYLLIDINRGIIKDWSEKE